MGLAYADVKKLNRGDISIGADGEEWVKTKRSKTDTRSNIPILPIAKVIIEKYKDNELLKEKKLVLPVLSNQKMNAYIKEILHWPVSPKTSRFIWHVIPLQQR